MGLMGLFWLISVVVVLPFLANPVAKGVAMGVFLPMIFVWTPGVVVYAWVTLPAKMDEVIKRSRLGLVYDKYLGLTGQVRIGEEMQGAEVSTSYWQSLTLTRAFPS